MPKFTSSRQEWHSLVQNSPLKTSKRNQAIFEAKQLIGEYSKNPHEKSPSKWKTSQKYFDFNIAAIGFILSFTIYSTLILQRNWESKQATTFAFSLGSVLTYSIIRFPFVQSTALLTIPGMSSSKGRSALAAIALAATLNGPGKNLNSNYEQISYSLACTQQISSKLTAHAQQYIEVNHGVLRHALIGTLNKTAADFEDVRKVYQDIEQNVDSIGNLVQEFNDFQLSIGEQCAKKLNEFFCIIPTFVASLVTDLVTSQAKNAMIYAENQLKFQVKITQKSDNSNQNNGDFQTAIDKIKADAKENFEWTSWVSFIADIMVFYSWFRLVFSTLKYRSKWKKNKLFDNTIVGSELAEVDKERYFYDKNSCFPISVSSVKMFGLVNPGKLFVTTLKERRARNKKMFRSILQVGMCVLVMTANRVLYFVLKRISTEISIQTDAITEQFQANSNKIKLKISGKGTYSESLTKLSGNLNSMNVAEQKDMLNRVASCLPGIHPVNLDQDIFIGVLIIVILFSIMFQPYIMRIRAKILNRVYPEIAHVRYLTLRNELVDNQGKVEDFNDVVRNGFWRIFGGFGKSCAGCGNRGSKDCEKCKSLFCGSCWSLQKKCVVCLSRKGRVGEKSDDPEMSGLLSDDTLDFDSD